MQQSSLVLFCDECGLANNPADSHCIACQHSLAHSGSMLQAPEAVPVTLVPQVLEVTPGPFLVAGSQSAYMQANVSPCDFLLGSILAERYRIQEEIGRGGFSVVYRAIDLYGGHREVAIKRIQLKALSPRQIIDATETFNREITMLARFSEVKGVPRFYGHLTDADNWYLVMQYITGQTLEDYLQKVPGGYLGEDETIELGINLAQILENLHAVDPPVIFRDVKPANIMLTPQHGLFLIDFGIARNFTRGKKKDTKPLGSPGFAPPEQYGRAQTDRRADIYSLGATLQTLFTGRDPLELRAGEPARNPELPSRALSKLLDWMLSPEAAKRPATMRSIKRCLGRARQRPFISYMAGLIAIAIISSILAFFIVSGWQGSMGVIVSVLGLNIVRIVGQRFTKKHGAHWFSWPFALLGGLTGLLPLLVVILWHIWRVLFGILF